MCPFIDKGVDDLNVIFKPLSFSGCTSSFFPLMCTTFPQMIQGVSLSRVLKKTFTMFCLRNAGQEGIPSHSSVLQSAHGATARPKLSVFGIIKFEYDISVVSLSFKKLMSVLSSKSKHIKAAPPRLWVHNELNHFQNCFFWVSHFLTTSLWSFYRFQWVKYQVDKPVTCQHYFKKKVKNKERSLFWNP